MSYWRYSLVLLRTHADEGDRTVREEIGKGKEGREGGKERGKVAQYIFIGITPVLGQWGYEGRGRGKVTIMSPFCRHTHGNGGVCWGSGYCKSY